MSRCHQYWMCTTRSVASCSCVWHFLLETTNYTNKAKAVPLHAMKVLWGEQVLLLLIHNVGPRWGWVVSVTPLPRFIPGERTSVPIVQEAGWAPEPVWTQRIEEKSFHLCRGSNLDRPVVQSVARHYTDWATPAPSTQKKISLDMEHELSTHHKGRCWTVCLDRKELI
jgi:hypothetical protein